MVVELVEYGAIAPALLGLLIAAGAGVAKSALVDAPRERRQRKLRATEIALSPFTGLQPSAQVQEADPFGSAIAFGATGAGIGGGIGQQQMMADAFQNQQIGQAISPDMIQPRMSRSIWNNLGPNTPYGDISGIA